MAATKEQERKALAQIKKIIADLGEDSYIGAAFGAYAFEIAEENIENDSMCSVDDMKKRSIEIAQSHTALIDENEAVKKENRELREQIAADAKEKLNQRCLIRKMYEFIIDRNREAQQEKNSLIENTAAVEFDPRVDGIGFAARIRELQIQINESARMISDAEDLL